MNGLEWLLRLVGTLALIYNKLKLGSIPAVSYLIKVKMHCAMMKEIRLKKTSVSNNLGWKKDATYWLLTQTCMLALEKCQILPFCPFQGHPLYDNGHEQQNHLDIATQPSYQCETLQAQFLWKQARKAPSYARWKQRLTDSQGWSVELLA